MKLPRDISGRKLARLLGRLGYTVTRESGSHIRLVTKHYGEHQLTIPDHGTLKVGTLSGILTDVANHFRLSKQKLIRDLFD